MEGYSWLLIIWIAIFIPQISNRARQRRQMRPRIRVTPEEFSEIVDRNRGLVIVGPKVLFSGRTYVTRSEGYYLLHRFQGAA
jgi:hypothetical protein